MSTDLPTAVQQHLQVIQRCAPVLAPSVVPRGYAQEELQQHVVDMLSNVASLPAVCQTPLCNGKDNLQWHALPEVDLQSLSEGTPIIRIRETCALCSRCAVLSSATSIFEILQDEDLCKGLTEHWSIVNRGSVDDMQTVFNRAFAAHILLSQIPSTQWKCEPIDRDTLLAVRRKEIAGVKKPSESKPKKRSRNV